LIPEVGEVSRRSFGHGGTCPSHVIARSQVRWLWKWLPWIFDDLLLKLEATFCEFQVFAGDVFAVTGHLDAENVFLEIKLKALLTDFDACGEIGQALKCEESGGSIVAGGWRGRRWLP
jgi:hypothetical protein